LPVDGTTRPQSPRLDELVRRHRRRAGLTQQEAAESAGMSVAALRDLEQGRVATPRPGTVRRLAAALRLSAAEATQLLRLAQTPDAAAGLQLQVLGPLAVRVGGAPVGLGSTTQRALLGLLALSPNTPVPRDALIEIVWGERPPPRVADLLQTHLSRLRRRLQPATQPPEPARLLAATAAGYQLTVTADQLDLLAFQQAVADARNAQAGADLPAARERYAQASALWRGEPLAGLAAFRIHPAVVALVRDWQAVVIEYAQVAEVLGRPEEVLPLLERVAEADPLNEAAQARLMIALAGSGQQAAALARFDQLRRRLVDDLGADPGPELADAHRRVLRQEVPRAGSTAATAHRQLPPDIADFTGRQAELAALHDRLPAAGAAGTAPVVAAIEGMAGVGKTRLAVHLAHQLIAAGRYADIQLYVDLRGYSTEPPADPATVLASFLHLLGVPGSQIPADLAACAALYRDRLHGRHALVLLDNAADEAQVDPLLPASPTNLVLVTSRRALALDGAHNLALDVFSSPDAEALLAQIVGPRRLADPAAVRAVIDLCGHLPLAVALAARRLQARPAWTSADLATRLADTGNRLGELAAGSRALRAVFDLSYRAMDGPAQRVFRLLGQHPGDDATADSTAALTGLDPATARGLLDHLVDEHLATLAAGDRYRQHDLLRAYARQLAETEEDEATRCAAITQLLDYYLHAVSAAAALLPPNRFEAKLLGPTPVPPRVATEEEATQWLQAERSTVTAAVSLAAERGRPAHAWRLAYALLPFLALHGYPDDLRQTQQVALAAARSAGDREGEATMLTFLGGTYLNQGRAQEALYHLQRALELHRESGDRTGQLTTLVQLGGACFRLGRYAAALQHTEQAAELCTGQDAYREKALRNNVGVLLSTLGRPAEALASYRQALSLAEQTGDRHNESGVLANIGDAYRRLGRHDEALTYLDRALAVASDHGLRPAHGHARHGLGQTYLALGRLDEAAACLTDALQTVRTVGGPLAEAEVLVDLAAVHRERGDLQTADELLRTGLRLATDTGERYLQARALDGLAHVHDRAGRPAAAEEHWQRAAAIFTELGTPEAAQIRGRR
jgi:DNA-binding SARP family transcriptional activator/Tfp pilus assembly protein PilF/DNA-binding XRE family transcriptional regulator